MREEKDELLVAGAHSVEALLEHFPERVLELWFTGEDRGRRGDLIERATDHGISVIKKKKDRFKTISADANHQGIAVLIRPQGYAAWDRLLEGVQPLILAFDQVTDPRNLGACLRTAEALGGTGALITKNRCARLGPTVCKTSVGASEILPVAMETNLVRSLTEAKAAGIQVVGTAFNGVAPSTLDFTRPTIIVVGSEGKGLRQSTETICDQIVTIPMAGRTASLNASVAASIVLYEARRQRGTAKA